MSEISKTNYLRNVAERLMQARVTDRELGIALLELCDTIDWIILGGQDAATEPTETDTTDTRTMDDRQG